MDRFWEGREFQPPIDEAMRLMEMFWSNADRVSWNPNHQFDLESTYAEGYRERGAPEMLVPFLSFLSQTFEPDLLGLVGDLMQGPKMVGAVADTVDAVRRGVDPNEVYSVVRNADGTPVRAYRVEAPGGGPGPIAQDLGLSGNARYYGNAEYASEFLRPDSLVLEGYPMARPGGYVDAARANGMDNVDLVARIEQSALDFAPPESRDFVTKVFNDYRAGTRDLTDVMNDLRHIYGHDMGPVPRSSGLDAMRQRVDDGRGVGEEIVTFGQERTFQNLNTYTDQEFRNLRPGR